MMDACKDAPSTHGVAGAFRSTHWSVILAAATDSEAEAGAALENLCRTYWFPIYAYLRRQNCSSHDAQDLTQSFLTHLLSNQRLTTVTPQKGKFRSFLLVSLKHFVANERDKNGTLKRGGHFAFISLDDARTEDRFLREPFHEATPDKAFARSWALTLIDAVLGRLSDEYEEEGKADTFAALQIYLSGEKGVISYADMAVRIGIRENAVKMAVLRLRRRFGELLRAEITNTVSGLHEVDEEIRCLFAAIST